MKNIIIKIKAMLMCLTLIISLMLIYPLSASAEQYNSSADFIAGKYGIFLHYLTTSIIGAGTTIDEWNKAVNSFDTDAFADKAQEMGASWVTLTLTQSDGVYCVPMPSLEKYVNGTKLSSDRDLVMDLSQSLSKKGIKLMLYWIPGPPTSYNQLSKAMGGTDREGGGTEGGNNNNNWKMNWTIAKNMASLMSELSLRYGDKVSGWWLDGCYDSIGFNQRVADLESAALKSGNPKAVVAFNNGTSFGDCRFTSEDYSAGETCHPNTIKTHNLLDYSSTSRWTEKGYQKHYLTFLGTNWCGSGLTYKTDELCNHVYENILKPGAGITFDMHITANGTLDSDQFNQMVALKNYVASKPAIEIEAAPEKKPETAVAATSSQSVESQAQVVGTVSTVSDTKSGNASDITETETKVNVKDSPFGWIFYVVIAVEIAGAAAIVYFWLRFKNKPSQALDEKAIAKGE